MYSQRTKGVVMGDFISRLIAFIYAIFHGKKATSQQEQAAEQTRDSHAQQEANRATQPKQEETAQTTTQSHKTRSVPVPEISSMITPQMLIDYLIEAESYTIHYNPGERGKTAPAGIYYKYYPDWEGWRFLTQIAQENRITFDPAASDNVGCRDLTQIVQEVYRDELDTLIYSFVKREYYDTLQLDLFPGSKSALSYFSITVNGGKRRSAKILQKVLKAHGAQIDIDGKAGPKTYAALAACGLDDDYLNQQILLQVYYFYNYLIGRSPSKYRRFYDGWINRLKRLGFVVPQA